MNFLIVKLGAVGDAVMSLSMVEAIFQKDPLARITWVCGKTIEPLIRAESRISEVIVVDDKKLLTGGKFGAMTEMVRLWSRIGGRRFDLIVTGHSDSRYGLLSLFCRAPIKRSFGTTDGRRWPLSSRYHGHEYTRLITGERGASTSMARIPRLNIPLASVLGGHLSKDKKIIAMAPGGARNLMRDNALRRWPVENYAQLAQKLVQKDYQVVLVGSESDQWVLPFFEKLKVTDLIGKTDLTQLAALLGRIGSLVTHDSGPMHLASMMGAQVVALFGPTSPHDFTSADNERMHVIWGGEKLACRPCYDGKNFDQCSDNQCLKSISVDRVCQQVLGLS